MPKIMLGDFAKEHLDLLAGDEADKENEKPKEVKKRMTKAEEKAALKQMKAKEKAIRKEVERIEEEERKQKQFEIRAEFCEYEASLSPIPIDRQHYGWFLNPAVLGNGHVRIIIAVHIALLLFAAIFLPFAAGSFKADLDNDEPISPYFPLPKGLGHRLAVYNIFPVSLFGLYALYCASVLDHLQTVSIRVYKLLFALSSLCFLYIECILAARAVQGNGADLTLLQLEKGAFVAVAITLHGLRCLCREREETRQSNEYRRMYPEEFVQPPHYIENLRAAGLA